MKSVAPASRPVARRPSRSVDVQHQAAVVSLRGPHRRPREVGRQLEPRRRAGETLLPVVELLLEDAAVEPPAMPDGVVGVLDLEVGSGDGTPVGDAVVQRRQIAEDDRARIAVGRDVVQHVQEDVVVVGEPDQRRPHHRVAREVERMLGLLLQEALQLGLALVRLAGRSGRSRSGWTSPDVLDDLHRRLADEVVTRAQDLVAVRERSQRALEHVRVDRPVEAERRRRVVRDAAIGELAQEPEELLRVRERDRAEDVSRAGRRFGASSARFASRRCSSSARC